MKKPFIISLLIILSLLSSCDDLEQVVDADLPYVEKLIIQGQFGINSRNLSVSVTKSIPPLEEPTLDKVTITDAECKVYYKDKVINLIHQGESIYVSEDTITIEEGVEYRLEVKWKDKFATASSTIPQMPELLSIKKEETGKYGYDQYSYTFNFKSAEEGMLGFSRERSFSYVYRYDLIRNDKGFFSLTYDDLYFTQSRNGIGFVFYDIQFYRHYVTRYEGDSDGGIFNNGGLNVEGNVEGTNTFGTWYGYNSFEGILEDYLEE